MKKKLCTIFFAVVLLGNLNQVKAQTGTALNFNGTNNYVSIAYAQPDSGITNEFWFNTTVNNQGIFSVTNGAPGASLWDRDIFLTSTGNLSAYVYDASAQIITTAGTNYADGNWHHVAHVLGTSVGGQKLYVDGVLKASSTFTTSSNASTTLLLGYSKEALNLGGNAYFNGSLDEVRIWKTTRTQTQIQANMSKELILPQTGLAAYYSMREGIANAANPTVTTAIDASNNGNTGTLTSFSLTGNTSNWVAPGAPVSVSGAALNFTGTEQGVSISGMSLKDSSFTIECWAMKNTPTSGGSIFGQGPPSNNSSLAFSFSASGQISFGFYNNDLNTVSTYTDTQWHHYAVVYNKGQTPNNRFIYRDGVLIASDHASSDFIGTGTFHIGLGGYNLTPFGGSLDEVRIWHRALCQGEIQNNMNGELALPQSALLAYYTFDEGVANGNNTNVTSLLDATGNNYTGTLNSFSLTGTTSNWVAPGGVSSGSNAPAFVSPSISISGPNMINLGSTATFTASGNVSTYAWSANAASATTATIAVTPTITTTYSVTGTNSVGCVSNMAVQTLTVNTPGAALNFAGTNNYVSIAYAQPATEITNEFWFNTSVANQGIFSVTNGGPTPVLWDRDIFLTSTGNLSAYLWNGTTHTITTTGTNYADGNWHHVAYVLGASVGGQKLYVDGALQASGTTAASTNASTTILLGYSKEDSIVGGNKYFNGTLDEVRIWKRALCLGEILSSMNGELPMPQTGLAAYYKFNQAYAAGTNTVTTAADSSGNAHTGTLINFALTGATSNWVAPGAVASGILAPAFVVPSINISGNNTICAGATTTLTAIGNVSTFTWTAGPNTAAYAVAPTANATYSVAGTNSVGCNSNMAVSTVTVNQLPSITVNSGTICAGGSFTINPSGANTYSYSPSGPVVTPTTNATYSVTGTNTVTGCASAPTVSSVTVTTCATSLDKYTSAANAVSVYPNPNNGSFVIEAALTNATCMMYDINGRLVLSQIINGKTTIDASNLSEGVYNITILSEEGVVNKRIVITK